MRGTHAREAHGGIRIVTRAGRPARQPARCWCATYSVSSTPCRRFYGVGLGVMMFSQESLRVGDMAAGTVLVYERTCATNASPQAAAERLGALDSEGAEIAAESS